MRHDLLTAFVRVTAVDARDEVTLLLFSDSSLAEKGNDADTGVTVVSVKLILLLMLLLILLFVEGCMSLGGGCRIPLEDVDEEDE